jgi:hypothetical protein
MRLSSLQRRERSFLLILFGCALLPTAVALAAAVRGASDVARLSVMSLLAGAVLALVALVAFERPRSTSPAAYAQQLKARLARMQAGCIPALKWQSQEEQHNGENGPP